MSKHEGLLILDAAGNLEGIITRSDILRAFEKDSDGKVSVLEAGTRDVVVTYPIGKNDILIRSARQRSVTRRANHNIFHLT